MFSEVGHVSGLGAAWLDLIRFASRALVLPGQSPVVLFGCLNDALFGNVAGAEGRYEGAVLAAQHDDIGV